MEGGNDVGFCRRLREWFADTPGEGDLRRYEARLVRIGRKRPIPDERLREIARKYVAELARRELDREQFEQVLRDPEMATLLWEVYCSGSQAGTREGEPSRGASSDTGPGAGSRS